MAASTAKRRNGVFRMSFGLGGEASDFVSSSIATDMPSWVMGNLAIRRLPLAYMSGDLGGLDDAR